jgi:hypothetical protein
MPSDLANRVLAKARIPYVLHWKGSGHSVYLTRGNQLIGSHAALKAFRDRSPEYKGWHSHHIVEGQDLRRLGVTVFMPPRDQQVCVLLPERGHCDRINSRLRTTIPIGTSLSPEELIAAYKEAYWLLGDYCGGGSHQIRNELISIVKNILKHGMY